MSKLPADSTNTCRLLQRARSGDRRAFERLFEAHRSVLRDLVQLRFDDRLAARLDPSDIVQEAHMEAYRRLDDYLDRRPMPFALWLRKTTLERLSDARRFHVEAAKRSVHREVRLPDRSSMQLAHSLLSPTASPSERLSKREAARRVRQAIGQLRMGDREVLLMRYVERLSNAEVAMLLEITPGTASKRHGRALLRLQQIVSTQKGDEDSR